MLFNNETSKSNATTPQTPLLILNEKTIRSLSDLRDHFDMDQVLKAHMDGILHEWLTDHFYEKEAKAIHELSIYNPHCKQKLCEILGVSLPISEEDAEDLKLRKEKLREYTDDPEVMKNIRKVAFDQEDLANLIKSNASRIYLCHNTFSVPLSKPNIHYIGIANPTIENPFTSEQYRKVGIIMENIKLPDITDSCTTEYAMETAKKNGYDDFHESHSSFTTAIHDLLKTEKYENYLYFSKTSGYSFNDYHSRGECRRAGEQVIKNTYNEAKSYLDTGHANCIAKPTAEKYSKIITNALSPVLDSLKTYCKTNNKTTTYHQIHDLVIKATDHLTTAYKEELSNNSDYYSLYHLDYFLDQLTIEEHDLRMETGLLGMLEWLDPKSFEYSYDGAFEAMDEIEKDINSKASSFYYFAYEHYKDYITKIEALAESIGADMPSMKNGETLKDYLNRQIIRNIK